MQQKNDLNACFLNQDWWRTATPKDVKDELAKGADVTAIGWRAPVQYAAMETSYPDVIKILVEAGADITRRINGMTALHLAAMYNIHPEIIEVLVKLGADVNSRKALLKWTPLDCAVIYKNPNSSEIIDTLIKLGATVDLEGECQPIKSIVSHCDDIEFIKRALKKCRNIDNNEMLMCALQNKNIEVFKLFWRNDTDINMKDECGRTMLYYAASYNTNPEMIKMLVELGADINNPEGENLILVAASGNSSPEVIKTLINYGVKVDAVNELGSNALTEAAEWNSNPEIITLLVECGLDVNGKNKYGITPLMRAANVNHNPAIIETLIGLGADINAVCYRGKTALDYAKGDYNNPPAVEVLQKY